MPTFNDSENKEFKLLPVGDYKFCVTGFKTGISKGAKTSGSDNYELELEVEGQGCAVRETLTDHESCSWKIDTFLKSAGIKLAKGEPYEFTRTAAEDKHVRWINPIGLRGWMYLKQEAGQHDVRKFYNKVGTFYTDKEKLPARVIEEDDIPF